MQVFKFGGASVKDAKSLKNMASIISGYDDKLVVVVSAMGKMTNAFEDLVKAYFKGDALKWDKFNLIKNFHNQIIDGLFESNDEIYPVIDALFFKIEDRLSRMPSLNFDFEYDQLVSYGEILSTTIISYYLNKEEISNKWIDIRFLLRTDDNWREANVDWELSGKLIPETLNFKDERLYITQGFIGATTSDLTTTLGREGSDYTAAILGHVLEAEQVVVWKDVPGILNADPQYFEHPRKIASMTYREAVELTFFGAKVIHPKTIKPLENSGIPLHVRSFLKPDAKGTIIGSDESEKPGKQIPVYIMKTRQVLITISQPDFSFMNEESMAWIFAAFSELRMKINMIQQSALNLSISTDIPEHGVLQLVERLAESFEVRYNDGLELITIRHYTPEAIEAEIDHRNVYLEQKTRNTARFLVLKKR
ncbi:MAG: aspartate kinase [Prolixibacteraceae bacterium]|jgi:aspartate kinase|nr:aspartate kinase [Prolixibacteraceae bacterium]